jgi:hypothetical protein
VRLLSGGNDLVRPLSSGKQIFETNKTMWPLTEPVPKLEAIAQCSGKQHFLFLSDQRVLFLFLKMYVIFLAGDAEYINDLPLLPRENYAAFVLTSVGQGYISNIDPTEALVNKFFVIDEFVLHHFSNGDEDQYDHSKSKPTNKCTILTGIRCICDPYICFGKGVAVFRGYITDNYKNFLHPSIQCMLTHSNFLQNIHITVMIQDVQMHKILR